MSTFGQHQSRTHNDTNYDKLAVTIPVCGKANAQSGCLTQDETEGERVKAISRPEGSVTAARL